MTHVLHLCDDNGSGWHRGAIRPRCNPSMSARPMSCFTPETLTGAATLSDLHAATLNMADPMLLLSAGFGADFNTRAELGPGVTLIDERQPLLP